MGKLIRLDKYGIEPRYPEGWVEARIEERKLEKIRLNNMTKKEREEEEKSEKDVKEKFFSLPQKKQEKFLYRMFESKNNNLLEEMGLIKRKKEKTWGILEKEVREKLFSLSPIKQEKLLRLMAEMFYQYKNKINE